MLRYDYNINNLNNNCSCFELTAMTAQKVTPDVLNKTGHPVLLEYTPKKTFSYLTLHKNSCLEQHHLNGKDEVSSSILDNGSDKNSIYYKKLYFFAFLHLDYLK